VDVAQAGQHGVHDQRDDEAHDGRHEAGRHHHVLPTARGVLDRLPVLEGRAHVRLQAGLPVGRGHDFQTVADGGHAFAGVRPVEAAVRDQPERGAVQLVPVGALQPLVVRQQRVVGRHERAAAVEFVHRRPKRRLAFGALAAQTKLNAHVGQLSVYYASQALNEKLIFASPPT